MTTRLPNAVRAYLLDILEVDRRPAYIAIGPDGVVRDCGGHLEVYGLERTRTSAALPMEACFLEGLLPLDEAPIFLPCLRTEFGMLADVHLFHAESLDWVVLRSAAASEAQERGIRQTHHDRQLAAESEAVPVLVAHLLNALDVATLTHVGGNRFAPLGLLPEWFRTHWPVDSLGFVVIPPTSAVLDHFLDDAIVHWRAGLPQRLRSGFFMERIADADVCLEASALTVAGQPILVVEPPMLDLETGRLFLQSARERALDLHEAARVGEASAEFRDALEGQVRERAAELIRLNQILEWELGQRTKAEALNLVLAESLEGSAGNICVLDAQRRIRFINRAFRNRYGFEAKELDGQPVTRLWPAGADPPNLESGGSVTIETEHATRTGAVFPVSMNLSAVLDPAGAVSGHILIVRDITEDRRTAQAKVREDEQRRQAQKMEAIGKLAAGVAHDFNNLLTVVLGHAERLLEALPVSSPLAADAGGIKGAALRAATLTRQLLTFGRKQDLQPRLVDVNGAVDRMRTLLERVIGEDILLKTTLGPDLPQVLIDPNQFELVLLNLAVNAREAMPEGGTLMVITSVAEKTGSADELPADLVPGQYVRLSVRDSGVGMDEAALASAFEPFFTTKAEGTGLGLATAYSIVKHAEGAIVAQSAIGKGSLFEVYLPARQGIAPRPEVAASPGRVGGAEVILLVEDETAVRNLAFGYLSRLGYRVFATGDPREALKAARKLDRIDLLLTDVIMPGGNGGDLARQLSDLHPEMGVLFMSGYSNGVLDHVRQPHGGQLLAKPFSMALLASTVRDVIDNKAPN